MVDGENNPVVGVDVLVTWLDGLRSHLRFPQAAIITFPS